MLVCDRLQLGLSRGDACMKHGCFVEGVGEEVASDVVLAGGVPGDDYVVEEEDAQD